MGEGRFPVAQENDDDASISMSLRQVPGAPVKGQDRISAEHNIFY